MEALLELVRTRQPACGRVQVVAVDGPSGAGKSSLADALADRTGAVVVRTDEFVPGWTGLARMPPALADGLLAHAFSTQRYMREVTIPTLTRGLERAGRQRADIEIGTVRALVSGRYCRRGRSSRMSVVRRSDGAQMRV